jgi:hypothetical protein
VKKVYVYLYVIFSTSVFGQPQLEHEFDKVTDELKYYVAIFFIIIILIFGIGATVMNLVKNKKTL